MPGVIAMPRNISGYAGDTADYVQKTKERADESLQKSIALGLKASGVFQKLDDVFAECSDPGWDGENAQPIPHEVLRNAWLFLEALPLGIEPPDIDAEPDGAITFEWYRSPRKVLSVSINPDDQLYYAALLAASKRHGVDSAEVDISEDLLKLINTVIG